VPRTNRRTYRARGIFWGSKMQVEWRFLEWHCYLHPTFSNLTGKHSFEIFKRTTSTHVNFSGFYLALGKFALCQTSTCTNDSLVLANLYHANGDLLFDYYHIAEQDSIENFIEITAYDKTTGDVGGNFQAVFEVDTAYILANGSTLFGAPNTIFMRNGSFSTKLIQ
jgi:hypothetical protein